MTATSHAIIGTVIAAKIGNPALAIPIAIASHVLADLFPHWDFGTHRKEKTKLRFTLESIGDVLLSFVVAYFLIQFLAPATNLIYLFIVVLAAQSVDWLFMPYLYLNMKFPPFSWAFKFSRMTNTKLDKPWGIIGQVWVLILLVAFAKLF